MREVQVTSEGRESCRLYVLRFDFALFVFIE